MKRILLVVLLAFGLLITGCSLFEEDDKDEENVDIPADPQISVPVTTRNNVQPTATFTKDQNNPGRIKVNLQGLVDPATNQPLTLYYNGDNPSTSNIFVKQDGVVKGLKVTKVGTNNVLRADVVFAVDHSGSMSEEADMIANSIVTFANQLSSSGLDVQFGCVGYDGRVYGAMNLTSSSELSNYLNRSGYTGTSRTYGFEGSDGQTLQTNAQGYATDVWGENGVVGVLYAWDNFAWRAGAQRVFINFTDEPTQPDNNLVWNTAKMCGIVAGSATVHTVFSEDSSYYYWSQYNERPWEMSECSGGTVIFIDPYATGVTLADLPVAGTLSNSYLVEYMKGSESVKEWLVEIVIYTSTADGTTTYRVSY